MTDPRDIAEGLTPAQRELLQNLVALEAVGLIERVPSFRDSNGMHIFVRPPITDLGRAVAAELGE